MMIPGGEGNVKRGPGMVPMVLCEVLPDILPNSIYDLTPYMTPLYNFSRGGMTLSSWDKLLNRILSLSKDLRFDELRKVLEEYGYEMKAPRGGSSHYTFRKAGCMPITIPKHEPIKKVYVEMVREIVESEAKDHEND